MSSKAIWRVVLVLIGVLIAWGGSVLWREASLQRDSAPRTPANNTPHNSSFARRVLTIVAFGDSTTAARDGLKLPYAQALADELPRRGVSANVVNAAVPGNNTTQALRRLETDVLARRPDLVIIQFGINDAMIDVWNDPPATASRVSKHDYEENLRAFVRKVRAKGGNVLLMTPNPLRWVRYLREHFGKPPYKLDDAEGFTFIVKEYAQIVRDVARAEKAPLVDVYSAFEAHGKQPGHSVDELLTDGVHPNDAGHRIIADLLIEEIVSEHGADTGRP